jgi:hypothetical protein
MLHKLGCIVTPDTTLRWYRELIAMKYDGSEHRRPGRPNKPDELRELVVRMAQENPSWGYTRIRDALANLGHEIARNTIKAILKEHGVEPVTATASDDSSSPSIAFSDSTQSHRRRCDMEGHKTDETSFSPGRSGPGTATRRA